MSDTRHSRGHHGRHDRAPATSAPANLAPVIRTPLAGVNNARTNNDRTIQQTDSTQTNNRVAVVLLDIDLAPPEYAPHDVTSGGAEVADTGEAPAQPPSYDAVCAPGTGVINTQDISGTNIML